MFIIVIIFPQKSKSNMSLPLMCFYVHAYLVLVGETVIFCIKRLVKVQISRNLHGILLTSK